MNPILTAIIFVFIGICIGLIFYISLCFICKIRESHIELIDEDSEYKSITDYQRKTK